MIATHVRDLTEELKRYDPLARLEFEVEVDGISPATQCRVLTLHNDLAVQLGDMKIEKKKIEDQLESLGEIVTSEIKAAFESDDKTDREKLEWIGRALHAAEKYL